MGYPDSDGKIEDHSVQGTDESPKDTAPEGSPDEEEGSTTEGEAAARTAELIDEQATPMVRWAVTGFVVTCALAVVLGSELVPPVQPGFEITTKAKVESQGSFLVTLDTRDRQAWTGIDLVSGLPTSPNTRSDLLVRRYTFRAPAGAVDLGDVPLESARVVEAGKWLQDIEVDGELENPAFARWYDYGRSSHLLTSRQKTYAVRLTDPGGVAYVRIVSYYCEPEGSGCMTLRYRLSLPPS